MDKLIRAMDAFQESVFEYESSDMKETFLTLLESLGQVVSLTEDHQRPLLNQILEVMLQAYQNKDYLLVADLVEFELKPFIIKSLDGEM